ncbi:hypothetical protein Shyhy02_12510 [Streptomyces hygroscopicus subsp. hygroscopicus]|nr:hypothetical protein Shyhy02_12510 [Streptomyces hygroscopicus subsp. hygroscopicus]
MRRPRGASCALPRPSLAPDPDLLKPEGAAPPLSRRVGPFARAGRGRGGEGAGGERAGAGGLGREGWGRGDAAGAGGDAAGAVFRVRLSSRAFGAVEQRGRGGGGAAPPPSAGPVGVGAGGGSRARRPGRLRTAGSRDAPSRYPSEKCLI